MVGLGKPSPNRKEFPPMSYEKASPANLSKKLPQPTRTSEFPRGLITDYIKLVDQLTTKAQKA